MKKDIDKLMKKIKIDAIYAVGKSSKDATMYYLLNGANIYGHYIKKQGKPACVIHYPIEREIAQKSSLKLINLNRYEIKKIFEKYPDKIKANAFFIKTIFDNLKINGDVAFYGKTTFGMGYNYLRQLIKFDKKIKIHYESQKDLITIARETKSEEEVKRIKHAGKAVVHAFTNMLETVRSMKIKNNVIMKDKNKKLLIGDLRAMLQRNLFEKNLVNSEGMIVAQGRDAGVPHNAGKEREVVKLGKTIVFDIYPQELGGGYFFDFTRTICFGYAPKNIKEIYNIVRDAQDYIIDRLKVGKKNIEIEKSICKFFEKKGHKTFLSTPKIQNGYCHSLGHGIGLNVHESPTFGLLKTNNDKIKPGYVFTIEPGLYYPDKGFGIRLEDVIYINNKGKVINLTNCPRKLVAEM
ncbi:Methionine aminopeptidase 1, mitochondrial [subsurface metagenome]